MTLLGVNMSAVGLLYVGAILVVNGLFLLGRVSAKGAAPLNFFVGGLQIFTPTYLIFTSGGDPSVIAGAAGLYLFGFTYIWVGLNNVFGWKGEGLGWFSIFVAICCVWFGLHNGITYGDWTSAALWAQWATLWFCFFMLLGLGKSNWNNATGSICLFQGFTTGLVPAMLMITGQWNNTLTTALLVAGFGLANIVLAGVLGKAIAPAVPVCDEAPELLPAAASNANPAYQNNEMDWSAERLEELVSH
jgi:hypothetical protein